MTVYLCGAPRGTMALLADHIREAIVFLRHVGVEDIGARVREPATDRWWYLLADDREWHRASELGAQAVDSAGARALVARRAAGHVDPIKAYTERNPGKGKHSWIPYAAQHIYACGRCGMSTVKYRPPSSQYVTEWLWRDWTQGDALTAGVGGVPSCKGQRPDTEPVECPAEEG